MRSFAICAILSVVLVSLETSAGETQIAKEALRDGLWDVARTHAAASEDPESAAIAAESFAKEGRWFEILDLPDGPSGASTGIVGYYKALALYNLGRKVAADRMLEGMSIAEEPYASQSKVLRAKISMEAGGKSAGVKAVEFVKDADFDIVGDDAGMVAADILDANGERADAEKIWRSVLSSAKADEKSFVAAAAKLRDIDSLRRAKDSMSDPVARRRAALHLGMCLMDSDATFSEGAGYISELAGGYPDFEGVKEAMTTMAGRYLSMKDYSSAADAYKRIFETWPDAAFDGKLHEGRGWALRCLGRREEAVESFKRAEESATNDTVRASAALARADVLAEMGRGEEAMAVFRDVQSKYPDTPAGERLKEILRRREKETEGLRLYNEYRFEKAREVFASLASEDPDAKPRMDYFDMLCLYGLGRDDEAWRKAEEIAAGSPDRAIRNEATLWMAKYSCNKRKWSDAGRLFRSYVALAPDSKSAPSALLWAAKAALGENDFPLAVEISTQLVRDYPASGLKTKAYLVQGEALMEQGRFDEAILVLERVVAAAETSAGDRLRARLAKADALFAMGADNPARYDEALSTYEAIRRGEALSPGEALSVSFKLARTLEKLNRKDEAVDGYYSGVVLAYRDGRRKGCWFDDEARAAFARAAFRLADEYEARGMDFQAMHILELVVASDVPAAREAEKRIDAIQMKGRLL